MLAIAPYQSNNQLGISQIIGNDLQRQHDDSAPCNLLSDSWIDLQRQHDDSAPCNLLSDSWIASPLSASSRSLVDDQKLFAACYQTMVCRLRLVSPE